MRAIEHDPALRLMIFISQSDRYRGRPLYCEIVRRGHQRGLAGASVFRGLEGFGASALIHTARLLSLSGELPVAIVIVDTEDKIRAFLPELDERGTEGLVILDPVQVYRRATNEHHKRGRWRHLIE